MIQRFTSQQKFIALLLGMAMAVLGIMTITAFFVFPLLQSEADEILAMKTEMALFEAKNKEIGRVQNLLQESSSDIKRVEHAVVDVENPLNFFESLYAIASSSGVVIDLKLAGARPSTGEGKTDFGIEVNIAIDGKGREVYAFLNLLELLPFQLEIQNLSVSSGVTAHEPFRMVMNVKALSR